MGTIGMENLFGGKKKLKLFHVTSVDCRWNNGTYQPTKRMQRAGAEEKKTERRDESGGVAEGCQWPKSLCGGREMTTKRIIDDRMLLGHDGGSCGLFNSDLSSYMWSENGKFSHSKFWLKGKPP